MGLEEFILEDYGTVPQKIGSFLLKNTLATLQQIRVGTGLEMDDLVLGVSILIQKRMIKFFIFDKTYRYAIVKSMIHRRMYFPVYVDYISRKHSPRHANYCRSVMIDGTAKEHRENELVEELLVIGLLRVDAGLNEEDRHVEAKHFRPAQRCLVVNYDYLDQKIFESETVKYVERRYNESAGAVLSALLCSEVTGVDHIIKNLGPIKIQITDHGVTFSEKECVEEYLKYLCSAEVVVSGKDVSRPYIFNSARRGLKIYRMAALIRDPATQRVFNMIATRGEVEDKDITTKSLLSVRKVKVALFALQSLGLAVQKCLGDYSTDFRIEHAWVFDLNTAARNLVRKLEQRLEEKLMRINSCWRKNQVVEDMDGSANVLISDFISLATDHLILSLDLQQSL